MICELPCQESHAVARKKENIRGATGHNLNDVSCHDGEPDPLGFRASQEEERHNPVRDLGGPYPDLNSEGSRERLDPSQVGGGVLKSF